jgi:hypothetical protein
MLTTRPLKPLEMLRNWMFKYCWLLVKVSSNFTEQCSSWEACSYSGRQEIPSTFWNMNIHYCICKSPPLANILSQTSALQFWCYPLIYWKHSFKFLIFRKNENKLLLSTLNNTLLTPKKGAPWSKQLSINRVKCDTKHRNTQLLHNCQTKDSNYI